MEDCGDIMCEVYADGDFEEPSRYADHGCNRYCNIKFNITYTFVPWNERAELLDDVYAIKEKHTRLVGVDELTKPDSAVFEELMEGMSVPLSGIIVRKIKDCALEMASDDKYKERRVLGMVVDLDVPRAAR